MANPPTKTILANHELARRTIDQHGTDLAIFDDDNLRVLRRFALDPSPKTQHLVLQELDVIDDDNVPEDQIGMKASNKGSLTGYVIARYGRVTDSHHTFFPEEVDALRAWFEKDGPGLGPV